MQAGSVWYVGAGLGDPELISVRGQHLLRQADLIVHDSGAAPELLEQCKRDATIMDAQTQGIASAEEIQGISRQIIEASQNGLSVVRLIVGDPLFYSRALEEIRIIRAAHVGVMIVPGISSPPGASAFAGAPLFGKRLLLCRPENQSRESARIIRERGAAPILLPLIDIAPPADRSPLERCVTRLDDYDWVILTSANGADRLMQAINASGRDARAFGQAKIAVIGPGTARPLSKWGIMPDLVAEEHVAEALARQLLAVGSVKSALLVRAQEARDVLPNSLRDAGIEVDVVAAYRTLQLADKQRDSLTQLIASRSVDAVLLTSSSMADSLVTALGPDAPAILSNICVASIGPITSTTLSKLGIKVDVTASKYTVEGLLDALERHFSIQPQGTTLTQGDAR